MLLLRRSWPQARPAPTPRPQLRGSRTVPSITARPAPAFARNPVLRICRCHPEESRDTAGPACEGAGVSTDASDGPSTAEVHAISPDGSTNAGPAESPALRQSPQVMLMLVGIPGSGKSSFSKALVAGGKAPWAHVNQDTVRANGKPGTRQQCLAAVRKALEAGACVVLDRCHADREQRREFVQLSKSQGVPVHAVMLDLPTRVCLARAKARTYHPKGVHGPAAAPIVWRMASQLVRGGRPSADEGLASVMVCRSEEDVAAALRAWASHGAVPGAPEDAAACDPWAVWQAYQQSSAPTSEKREAPAADAALLLQVGQVVEGEVDGIKPYGVFLKLTGLPGSPVGLMHKSQISMERIRQGDLVQLFPIGSTLKAMVLALDKPKPGRITLSTKKLEPFPGAMLKDRQAVMEGAEEQAAAFRERLYLAMRMENAAQA